MKRKSFSAVITALSFLVASGSAVSAQDFPSTGHQAFSEPAQAAGQLITSLLPPMPGYQDPSHAVAPAAIPPGQSSPVAVPATAASTQINVAPQQVQAVPQQIVVAPQQTTTQQIQALPQQIQASPQQVQIAPQQVQAATQSLTAPQQIQALQQQLQTLQQQVQTAPRTYAAPATGSVNTVAPSVTSAAPIYVQQSHGEVFSNAAGVQSVAMPTADAYTPPASQIYTAPATQSVVTTNVPSATTIRLAPVTESVLQVPELQQSYNEVIQSPQSFVIDDSQLVQNDTVVNRPRRILQRQNRGCGSCLAGASQGSLVGAPSRSVYSTIGVSALLFNRNVGNDRNFSTNSVGDVLSSNNANENILGGIDAFLTRRKAGGRGWEARYFGLYPSDESIQVGNNATHLMPGYNQLGTSIAGTGPTAYLTGPSTGDLFNRADTHVLTRQTELNNIEFNILRGTAPRFRALQTEFLFGFRYFQFGETLLHEAVDVANGDATYVGPDSIGYFSSVENNLLGLQIGARSDYQLRSRLMMHIGVKAGAFNNQINTRQRVDYRMPDGSIVNPQVAGGTLSGQNFDIGGETDVKSILGELDVAFSYALSGSARIRAGYRALGVTDIGFASNQVQDDFTDASRVATPYTDGTLVTQGSYVGLEFAY